MTSLAEWQRSFLQRHFEEGTLVRRLEHFVQEVRIFPMNPCKVEGCGKTDDQKPMAFRGEDYCSDIHRKILAGELKLVNVETFSVEGVVVDEPKAVVE